MGGWSARLFGIHWGGYESTVVIVRKYILHILCTPHADIDSVRAFELYIMIIQSVDGIKTNLALFPLNLLQKNLITEGENVSNYRMRESSSLPILLK